jgi:hypothetical protein
MDLSLSYLRRYLLPSVLLIGYALYLNFVFNWFNSGEAAYLNSCGSANGALMMGTVFFSVFCSLALLIISLFSKGIQKLIFLLFMALSSVPFLWFIGVLVGVV